MRAVAKAGPPLLAALFVAACATPSSPRFDLTEDCRLRSLPWSASSAATPVFGFGVGGYGGRPAQPRLDDGASEGSGGRTRGYSGGGLGAGFGLDLGGLLAHRDAPDFSRWLVDGPGFADRYSNGCIPIRCFVRGGWPLVVDYTADGASVSTIEIHVPDAASPVVLPLDNARGRRLVQLRLPDSLGGATSPAVLLVRSVREAPGGGAPGNVRIHALGAGPRAVGSVAIERVEFAPARVQRSAREHASYSFVSKSDFNHVAVEVLRVENIDGEIRVGLARGFRFDGGISRDTVFGRSPPRLWDGTDAQDRPSLGSHVLQVRAWMSLRDEADWVTAWSEDSVVVAE